MRRTFIAIASALVIASSAGAQVTIEIGSAEVVPGGSGSFQVTIRTTHGDVGGTGNGIGWVGPVSLDGCSVNPDIERNASAFAFLPVGCTDGGTCSSLRSLILSFGIPEFPPPLEDGVFLYSCSVTASSDAMVGDYPLACSGPEAATREGVPIDTDCSDGLVMVREATPTATPTATTTSPPATATSEAPTETPTPNPCPGDCDGNRAVTIEELVAAVRIALGDAGTAICPSANPDGDLIVSISELVRAVRAALDGCP